jgi:molybdopterin-containing oxidoreductase family iron-sulfur binding subunit
MPNEFKPATNNSEIDREFKMLPDQSDDCLSGDSDNSKPVSGQFIPLTAIKSVEPMRAPLDMEKLRKKLANQHGQKYWRSLEELADDSQFKELVDREFSRQAPGSWQGVSRRDFLRLMGAGLALAGLSGCARQPDEEITPYVKMPEDTLPGRPLFYATAETRNGFGRGLLVRSNMGRPTKVDGNPDHPVSLGRTDSITQATLLSMYDPDRSQRVLLRGEESQWSSFLEAVALAMQSQKAVGGAGLRILTETVTSPTLVSQMQELLKQFPKAQWHQWEVVNRDMARQGARMAFGRDAQTVYNLKSAKAILSLDANFLYEGPDSVRLAREFADGRRVRHDNTAMNRLYVVESTPTITGTSADHSWPLKASDIEPFTRAIATAVGVSGAGESTFSADKRVQAMARDLMANRGKSLVIPGEYQSPVVHALAHAINAKLGAIGKMVRYTESVEASPVIHADSLSALVADMNAGKVQALFILGGNPVYDAPADLKFGDALQKVALRAHVGLYNDETASWSHWHVPQTHYLEEWSDVRAYDGTTSIVQPLIAPLYDGKSFHEVLAALLGQANRKGYDIVRAYWSSKHSGADFEVWWRKALNDGVIANTGAKPVNVTAKSTFPAPSPIGTGLEICFRPDCHIGDGRYANSGWLQELPRPLTKVTWDNAALVSPATAQQLGIAQEQVIELDLGAGKITLPVFVLPGQPDNSINVQLGYGRTKCGQVGSGVGSDTYLLRTSKALWFTSGLQVKKTNDFYHLATTQHHHTIDFKTADTNVPDDPNDPNALETEHGRDVIKVIPIAEFAKNPEYFRVPTPMADEAPDETQNAYRAKRAAAESAKAEAQEEKAHEGADTTNDNPSFYGPIWPSDRTGIDSNNVPTYKGVGYGGNPTPQWAMTIDLTTCIGCNACTIGCQAENNIATVGKHQTSMGREMHWIRVDRYYDGDVANPATHHQPLPCMQCEKAPCEYVCPVEATSHSVEGINEQTYNRCIGTRYCSNNCPYKVRRFNFLQYSELASPTISLMHNPNVTTRARGVMEKCTYCVQRINDARWHAEVENRVIKDGEVTTACQQVCPTDAIIFGNIVDKESEIYKSKAEPHNYGVLTDLNTYPRTTYLARLRNPNPELEGDGASQTDHDNSANAKAEAAL